MSNISETVFHSTAIGLNYKLKKDPSGFNRVIFEDNVNYQPFEIKLLNDVSDSMLKSVHLCKKVFAGEVIAEIQKREKSE